MSIMDLVPLKNNHQQQPMANALLDWDKHLVSVPENWTLSTKMNEAIPCLILPENGN